MASSQVTTTEAATGNIKLHADEMNIRQYNMFIGVVVLLLGAVFLLASALPPAHIMKNRPEAGCIDSIYSQLSFPCQPFDLNTNPVVSINVDDLYSSNGFVSIGLLPFEKTGRHDLVAAKVQINVWTNPTGGEPAIVIPPEEREVSFECLDDHSDCEPEMIFTLTDLEDKHYYFILKFLNNEDLKNSFDGFAYTTMTFSLVYRNYVFVIKLLFLIVSLVGYFLYSGRISNLKKDFYCQEQKALQLLVPLLIVINEPITSHILGGAIYSWIVITLFVAFSATLVYLWLVVTDELAGSDSSLIDKVSRPIQLYTILYFAAAWLTYTSLHSNMVDEPSIGFASEPGFFSNVFKLILYAVVVIGFGWIGWKGFGIYQRIAVAQEREAYFFWFSLFFIIAQFYLVARGGLDPFNHHDAKSVTYSGVFTLYVLAICYLYQPTQEGIEEANRRKKYENPEAKNKYNDLDDSPEPKPKASEIALQAVMQPVDAGSRGEVGYVPQVNTVERGLNEQQPAKYPYEHGSENDL